MFMGRRGGGWWRFPEFNENMTFILKGPFSFSFEILRWRGIKHLLACCLLCETGGIETVVCGKIKN